MTFATLFARSDPRALTRPRPRARGRVGSLAVAMVVGTLALGGCTLPGGPKPAAQTGTVEAEPVEAALSPFYTQQLAWSSCGDNQCATLSVPLDYANPGSGEKVALKILKVPASSSSGRLGSLLVNPGGPGASGAEYASYGSGVVSKDVLRYYDLIGFDPRGVGDSEPVDCLDDKSFDTFLGTDSSPDDAAEEQQLKTVSTQLATGCTSGENARLAPYMSTEDVARDLDILRAALGDERLNYLGKSYGTLIGSTYADLFPKRVGRMVLDGVLPPDVDSTEMARGQAVGFESATRAWAADCVAEGSCAMGATPDAAVQGVRDLLARLDRSPIPTGDPSMPQLNEAWASLGIAYAMYDQGKWSALTEALAEAKKGDGSAVMSMADAYAGRSRGGTYRGNDLEAMYAVNCLDRPDSPDLAHYEQVARDLAAQAPTMGAMLAWGNLPCGLWPVKGGAAPHTVSADGSNTIVVVGTTRDPATPYEWSVRLNDQLSNSVLLTMDGDGHTAYGRANSCIDKAVDAFYVSGTTPKDGTRC